MTSAPPQFGDPAIRRAMMNFRRLDDTTNLAFILLEYVCLVSVIGSAVVFGEYRASWGLSWSWNIPVFTVAVLLIGGLQHRLAGLAHEASHYTLVKNKLANDLLADIFCLFPLFSTIHFYRLFHMAHHQYTNDPSRDPDLLNMGRSKKVDEFPMTRWQFCKIYYARILLYPLSFIRYQWDYIYVNVMGKGASPYVDSDSAGSNKSSLPRLGTVLGLVYLLGLNALLWYLTSRGHARLMLPLCLSALAVSILAPYLLPAWALFRSPFRQPYSARLASSLRLGYLTLLMFGLAWLRWRTQGRSAVYVAVLWLVPMTTSFMIYMLLRDVYQHANADRGRLTNSRVFFSDAFTRWAVFVYGQDMHIPHHLFPAIPHYNLPALHSFLRSHHQPYSEQVVECRGTFRNDGSEPTILDVLTTKPTPVSIIPASHVGTQSSRSSLPLNQPPA